MAGTGSSGCVVLPPVSMEGPHLSVGWHNLRTRWNSKMITVTVNMFIYKLKYITNQILFCILLCCTDLPETETGKLWLLIAGNDVTDGEDRYDDDREESHAPAHSLCPGGQHVISECQGSEINHVENQDGLIRKTSIIISVSSQANNKI